MRSYLSIFSIWASSSLTRSFNLDVTSTKNSAFVNALREGSSSRQYKVIEIDVLCKNDIK